MITYADSCATKTAYFTFTNANKAARILQKNKGDIVHAYKCKFCKFYHVGHDNRISKMSVRTKGRIRK